MQILDLSHNELGSETPRLIKCVIPTLISLNLSHTQFGSKGAFLLAQELKIAHKKNKRHYLRALDLSNNLIDSSGFLKLMSRLKKSTALYTLNFSYNDFSEEQEKFINVEKFLSRNESCLNLYLNGCRLKSPAMAYVGLGLSKNRTLEKLSLIENNFVDKECITYLVKGLIENVADSHLVELDLQKNRLSSALIEPLSDLFLENVKIRSLNLKNNMITDEGAQVLLQTIGNNKFICKVNMEMNPIRQQLLIDIQKYTAENQTKVTQQEVPQMIKEVVEIKKEMA